MMHPDTEAGVQSMFTGHPEFARVERSDSGAWLVIFADGAQATAYPLEGRFENDPLNDQRRAHAQGKLTEADCFGEDLD